MMYWYYVLAYFLIYSFLGWALEVAFHVVTIGKIINRGFLNGPYCPIYGVGMVGILVLLSPLLSHPVALVLGGVVFATVVELVGGVVLYKLFHLRWWDYSKEPFNLGGFICLRFSIAWGICIVFALKVIHPFIELNVHILDNMIGYVAVTLLCIIFLFDIVITVLSINNLNKDLKHLNALAADIRKSSDELTEKIGKTTFDLEVRVQEGRVQAALARAEGRDKVEEIRDDMNAIHRKLREDRRRSHDAMHKHLQTILDTHPRLQKIIGYHRISNAFPNLQSKEYDHILQALIAAMKAERGFRRKAFDKKALGVKNLDDLV